MHKLLLLIDTMFYYDREILKGITSKVNEYQLKISIHIESIENVDDILSQQWDYVIADFDKADHHEVIPRLTGNILLYSSYQIDNVPPLVSTLVNDNEHISSLALGQFVQNNIKNVAFYTYPSEANSGWALERKHYFEQHAQLMALNYFKDVRQAVALQQYPLGVYCASDRAARKLVNFCVTHNIAVPSEISIIGTDYDDAERKMSAMPLSSINVNPYNLGRRCIEVLVKAKRFNKILAEKYQPTDLINEYSTIVEENQDQIVNNALYYLHNNFHLNIKVQQVVEFCKTSRKTLDNRFIACKNITVHQYLSDLRIAKSKKLLRMSSDSIESIALQCGYPNLSYLYQVYKKKFDYTPYEYRQDIDLI
ncbi:helix-turn-helix domain-containing protein [Psychromonas sp. MME2]|uniref:AraC family transcriptional regulator n=1 Tax=unclassified Psychromonas TaxID=2614957 RepID=UPI00339C2A6B